MNYIIYNNRTGQIIHGGTVTSVESVLKRVKSGQHEVISFLQKRVSGSENYVVDEQIVPRPELDLPPPAVIDPPRNATDLIPLPTVFLPAGAEPVAVLSGLPEGTAVEARGVPVPVVDGAALMVPADTDLHVAPPFPWRAADVRVVLEP